MRLVLLRLMLDGAFFTVIVHFTVLPLKVVAVIVAVPALLAVTKPPAAFTLATEVLFEVYTTLWEAAPLGRVEFKS